MRKQAINSSSLRIAVRKNYSLLLVVGFHFADFEILTANRTDALLAFVNFAFHIVRKSAVSNITALSL